MTFDEFVREYFPYKDQPKLSIPQQRFIRSLANIHSLYSISDIEFDDCDSLTIKFDRVDFQP